MVAKFSAKPSEAHLIAAKRILQYLKGTALMGLKYQKGGSNELVGYSDADWAGDLNDRHSTTGNLFMMAGGVLTWLSKKQPVVALSTVEAEYIAVSSATQEAVWLRRLLSSVGAKVAGATVIFEDNQGAIAMSKNPVSHARTKHIDIKFHYIREAVENGSVQLKYCSTEEMLADLLTKPLTKVPFQKFRPATGVQTLALHNLPNK